MRRFLSLDEIRKADVETLAQVETMNVQSARAVYEFFTNQIVEALYFLCYNERKIKGMRCR